MQLSGINNVSFGTKLPKVEKMLESTVNIPGKKVADEFLGFAKILPEDVQKTFALEHSNMGEKFNALVKTLPKNIQEKFALKPMPKSKDLIKK